MAARRQEYRDLKACFSEYRWIGKASVEQQCQNVAEVACRYCICCEHCACELNPWSLLYIVGSASIGIVLLIVVASLWKTRSDAETRKQVGEHERDASEAAKKKKANPLYSLKKEEIVVVQRVIELWHNDGVISPDAKNDLLSSLAVEKSSPLHSLTKDELAVVRRVVVLWHTMRVISPSVRDDLLSSLVPPTTTESTARDESQPYLAVALVIFSFTIFLFESVTSDTLLHNLVSPFMSFVSSPVLGKGGGMLLLAAGSLFCPNNKFMELIRGFLTFAFFGCITLSVVDTGRHSGETSRDKWGSQLWYMVVGVTGVFGFSILHNAVTEKFCLHYFWMFTSLGLLFRSNSPGLLCVASFIVLLLPARMEQDKVELVGLSFFLLGAVALRLDSFDPTPWDDIDGEEFLNVLFSNIISPLLVVGGLLMLGIARKSVPFVAAGTIAWCLESSYQLATVETPIFFGLNLPLRLSVFFTLMCLGGRWLLYASRIKAVDETMREAMGSVLVGFTLVLLLVVVVVGNEKDYEGWTLSMDFGETFRWTEGYYQYDERMHLLPWALPIILYYRMLYFMWPQFERRLREFHVLAIVLLELFACHLLRSVSWSTLILLLAGLVWKLEWLEEVLRGGP